MTISDKIRQTVRKRADNQCEYCLRAETATGFSFHVDHIIAVKHGGTDELVNLAWSCFHCNVFKGTDIASYDVETGALTRLFNPRIDEWQNHFNKNDLQIEARSAIGRVTIHILKMNHPDQIEIRLLLRTLDLW